MTKQASADEGFPKYHMPLEEANKLIEANVKILSTSNSSSLGIHTAPVKSMRNVAVQPHMTRIKVASLKTKLGKAMQRLYNLEPEPRCVPEKNLNVDFGVNLYQMEDY